MENHISTIKYKEGQQLLFDSSFRAIPFNIVMSMLLGSYLSYESGAVVPIIVWLLVMISISCLRMVHCKIVTKKLLNSNTTNLHLNLFLFLTMATSLTWSAIYFIAIAYGMDNNIHTIILFFAGMSAGATTSLSIYFPSFLVYVLSMFLPIIIYKYYFYNVDNVMMATIFLLFSIALILISKSNQRLFERIFYLTEQNKILLEKFEILSITDPLTGSYNRRHFDTVIKEEYNRAKRNEQSFSLVSIDIDNFKLLNDNFGHTFGDKFIIYTVEYLKNYLRRSNDIVFRLGGDEFFILLLNTTEEKTQQVCDTIKSNFIKTPSFDYDQEDSQYLEILSQISISMGVVHVPYDSITSIEQIIEIVDKLLYKAKDDGKNEIKYTKCK